MKYSSISSSMVLSKRISIQWLSEQAGELTDTLVISTPKCFSTDVRIFKEHYPYEKGNDLDLDAMDKIFEFVSMGTEIDIEGTNQVQFPSEVNLQEIVQAIKTGKSVEECKAPPDIGTFWPIEGSEDRKETGSMVNPATGVCTDYVEVWRSLNPAETTPDEEVRENHWKNKKEDTEVGVYTYNAQEDNHRGRLIRLGNWVQAVFYAYTNGKHELSVLRAYYDESSGQWQYLIRYGPYDFPDLGTLFDKESIDFGGVLWTRVE